MRTKDPKTISYETLEPRLRTGDLFLFHGIHPESKGIEKLTRSRFSHASMIVRPDPKKPPMIWQEGPDPLVRDTSTRSKHGGAQLGDLRAALRLMWKMGDTPYVRRLTVRRTPDFETVMQYIVKDMDGRPFPILKTALRHFKAGLRGKSENDSTLFCAELTAETYMRLGLLLMNPPPNAYVPHNFAEHNRTKLKLRKGATLGPEMRVAIPTTKKRKKR
jgi:hypothetical protein